MDNELKLANFIFLVSKNTLQDEKDLIFSLNKFIETEEYEKCILLNKLINSKKFKKNKKDDHSHYQFYLWIQKAKNKINSSLEGLIGLRDDSTSDNKGLNDSIKKGERLLETLEEDERDFFKRIEKIEEEIKNLENSTGIKLTKVKDRISKIYGNKKKQS